MQRRHLAAAVALAPLIGLGAGEARAQTQISSVTSTPLSTSSSGDITIVAGGAITPTSSGAAVTLNSNATISTAGTVSFENVSDATAILVEGGFTGTVINTGIISVSESYVAALDTNNDGLADGPFAQGDNRFGIQVVGSKPFDGGILTSGPITVQGNNSDGIDLEAPITGSLMMYQVTPATSTTAALQTTGAVTVVGDDTIGVYVAPKGGVGGDMQLTSVSATGVGAQGVVIDGAVGGQVNVSGVISATGYRSTTRQSLPQIANLYQADEMEQGGPALVIGASIGKGLDISAPPFPLSTTDLDEDKNGVPDSIQGAGSVSEFGAAPAIQIGAASAPITLGLNGKGQYAYGFLIEGSVTANGVFDPLLSPNLPAVVPATAIVIGLPSGGAVNIAGGVRVSGSVAATAYQANAFDFVLGSGANTPAIVNDGSVTATSVQVNTATTGPAPVTVDAIQIAKGANVPSIRNNYTIIAQLNGTSGVGGAVGGIIDNSGSVRDVFNGGTLIAELTQTVEATPMPGTATALDLSAGTGHESFVQALSPVSAAATAWSSTATYKTGQFVSEYGNVYEAASAIAVDSDPSINPTLWKVVGVAVPSLAGDMRFGSGGTNFTVTAGTVTSGVIDLGSGVDKITVNGPVETTTTLSSTGAAVSTVVGTSVTGSIEVGPKESGTLNADVTQGTLDDTNPIAVKAGAINVGASGVLIVAADPVNKRNTEFLASGASTFAAGAQLGLTMQSIQAQATEQYVVLQTTGHGTLQVGGFGAPSSATPITPYLYTATPSYVAASGGKPGEVILTVTEKTAAQLGFNRAEASALNAVLAAIPANVGIEQTILAQTTQAGLQQDFDQLLPSQGQGLFEAIDAAAERISDVTGARPDAGTPVATGSSVWLQEVNERVDRHGTDSVGSNAKVLGLVAGIERGGFAGGSLGFTLAYLNGQEADSDAAVGAHVVASMVEGGVYYRYGSGPFTIDARGAGGFGSFSSVRRFVSPTTVDQANSAWDGYFADGHLSFAYEQKLGRFYLRPEFSADYLYLTENAHNETGGGPGFDLDIASRASSQGTASAVLTFGTQFGRASWLRPEIRAGWREIFAGQLGDTVANFAGGDPFILSPDKDNGGWATVGFSIKGGSAYSYIALEGDLDLRPGEQRYDLRIAGRTAF